MLPNFDTLPFIFCGSGTMPSKYCKNTHNFLLKVKKHSSWKDKAKLIFGVFLGKSSVLLFLGIFSVIWPPLFFSIIFFSIFDHLEWKRTQNDSAMAHDPWSAQASTRPAVCGTALFASSAAALVLAVLHPHGWCGSNTRAQAEWKVSVRRSMLLVLSCMATSVNCSTAAATDTSNQELLKYSEAGNESTKGNGESRGNESTKGKCRD